MFGKAHQDLELKVSETLSEIFECVLFLDH